MIKIKKGRRGEGREREGERERMKIIIAKDDDGSSSFTQFHACVGISSLVLKSYF